MKKIDRAFTCFPSLLLQTRFLWSVASSHTSLFPPPTLVKALQIMVKHELVDAEMPDTSKQRSDNSSQITLRSIITNRQAVILIGESGSTITNLRNSNDANIDVSEQLRGAIERILTISGDITQIANTYRMVVKALVGEDSTVPSTPESVDFDLRMAVPHVYLGAIIGSGGYRLRQITESSSTKIQASEFCLPLSSERTLTITGRADNIGSAISELGKDVLAQKARAETAMNNPFMPVSMFGRYGHPDTFRNVKPHDTMMTPSNPYGVAPASFNAPVNSSTTDNIVLPDDPRAAAARGATKDKLVQQIYIPNDMVGAIIGKSGSKINEIRTLSGSHVKINEPDASRATERLITVEGTQEQNQLALYMLYQRLESEKRR